MRVVRGNGEDATTDRQISADLLARTAETGEQTVRVWQPYRQVAFGRRDTRSDGYQHAREIASDRGFEPVERSVGGRPVAYTGTTIAFARTVPVEDFRTGLDERYGDTTTAIQRALWRLGVPAQRGEPDHSFCPGQHSLAHLGKIVGIAQRVQSNAAVVAGIVIVADHGEIADVLEPVYDTLDVPFDRESVGSIAKAGGRSDPNAVAGTLESLLVGDREYEVEYVGQ